ncbi:chymotrypsinogen B-like [Actinia tenebrosa]|uniref:Chymotrypsinogen B-like n=1 Tax=Actinia tenebrosa TaxID=6105 RepID=A0A6P8J2Y6_ACTTE|nr:chymotrypsinogen B-like [Actinia tenebrosa]
MRLVSVFIAVLCCLPLASQGLSCGLRPADARIVQGHDAVPHSWPWQVLLQENGGFTCGGTLIRPDWVITATHCIIMAPDPKRYTVVVGAHHRKGSTTVQQVVKVKKIFKHTGFLLYHYKDDIALLQLEHPVKLSSKVNLACLPTEEARVGDQCFVSGWGRLHETGAVPDILQQAVAPIASHADCKKQYKTGIYRYTHLCAGQAQSSGASACQGDSGGPLVCKVNGRWFLHGIVSFSASGCLPTHYTVYTRVSSYIKWIFDRIGGNPPTKLPALTTNKPTSIAQSTNPPVQPSTRPEPTQSPTTGPEPTQSPTTCKDKASNCQGLQNICHTPFMKRFCARTCKAC